MTNSKVLKDGAKKARLIMLQHMENVFRKYAEIAVLQAVQYWREDKDAENLTGNTIAGFSAGVYVDGKCVDIVNALEVAGINSPTSGYTFVGDKGLEDYDSGEIIEDGVREYGPRKPGHFVKTKPGGNSIDDTRNFLLKRANPPKKGVFVVVANCSPYINFLREVRNLELLDKTMSAAERNIITEFIRRKMRFNMEDHASVNMFNND